MCWNQKHKIAYQNRVISEKYTIGSPWAGYVNGRDGSDRVRSLMLLRIGSGGLTADFTHYGSRRAVVISLMRKRGSACRRRVRRSVQRGPSLSYVSGSPRYTVDVMRIPESVSSNRDEVSIAMSVGEGTTSQTYRPATV